MKWESLVKIAGKEEPVTGLFNTRLEKYGNRKMAEWAVVVEFGNESIEVYHNDKEILDTLSAPTKDQLAVLKQEKIDALQAEIDKIKGEM